MRNLNNDIDEVEESIKKLRIAYEKYFAGIERLEPSRERDKVKANLRRLRSEPNRNTARRFRLQQLQATLVTHENYWNRLCRQIEEGTFKRDVRRAKALMEQREAEARAQSKSEYDEAKKGATTRARKPASGKSYSDGLQKLHTNYLKALATTGSGKNISIDSLAKTVASQTAAIKKKFNCNDVEFKVAVKGGKAILKAVPK